MEEKKVPEKVPELERFRYLEPLAPGEPKRVDWEAYRGAVSQAHQGCTHPFTIPDPFGGIGRVCQDCMASLPRDSK